MNRPVQSLSTSKLSDAPVLIFPSTDISINNVVTGLFILYLQSIYLSDCNTAPGIFPEQRVSLSIGNRFHPVSFPYLRLPHITPLFIHRNRNFLPGRGHRKLLPAADYSPSALLRIENRFLQPPVLPADIRFKSAFRAKSRHTPLFP